MHGRDPMNGVRPIDDELGEDKIKSATHLQFEFESMMIQGEDEYNEVPLQLVQNKSKKDAAEQSRKEDMAIAGRKFPNVEQDWKVINFRIIIVGESGTGKSTFIDNLFYSYTGKRVMTSTEGDITSSSVFRYNPQLLCSEFTVENPATKIRMNYAIQDTPGYGDTFSPKQRLLEVVEFIRCQQRTYMGYELNLMTDAEKDPRIDICLFFIPPHRLKEIDIDFMRNLSQVVPLIPIVAKADSMTTQELDVFRTQVREMASDRGIDFFTFSKETLAASGVSDTSYNMYPPFAIISGKPTAASWRQVEGQNIFWPCREYKWGQCEAFNRNHSDFSILKVLLLEHGLHEVKASAKQYYTKYKKHRMEASLAASSNRFCEAKLAQCLICLAPFLHPSSVQFLHEDLSASTLLNSKVVDQVIVRSDAGYILPPEPIGRWRHGLFECFRNPGQSLITWCLPFVPIAQLYERMISASTFVSILVMFVLIYLVHYILLILKTNGIIASWLLNTWEWIVWGLFMFFIVRIRSAIRIKYSIPEICCHAACEDFCCAYWCPCCVISQMWSHVNDPSHTGASGCTFSETGLPKGLLSTVWYPDQESLDVDSITTQPISDASNNKSFRISVSSIENRNIASIV